jgi:ParB-like chromosome segregation protein Spo0J
MTPSGGTRTSIIRVPVNAVQVGPRLRALRPELVTQLVEGMRERGQPLSPIAVYYQNGSAKPQLVYGWHRLEAAKRLGLKVIEAIVMMDLDADAATFAEIDENLIRGELTPAERAAHIGKRKALYETLHPETRQGGDRRTKIQTLDFASDVAAKTDRSKSSIAADVTRARHIPDVGGLAWTSLDKGEELDALARLKPEQQAPLIARAKAGEKVTAIPEPPHRNRGFPRSSGYKRVSLGFYVEPRSLVDQILDAETSEGRAIEGRVHDPCCGTGTIPSRCLERGIRATGSDIVNRGFGEVRDLFDITEMIDNAISNIPYNLKAAETGTVDIKAEEIIRHLLTRVRRKLILILPMTFWESVERDAFFREHRPIRSWVCVPRPSMPPGRMDGERDRFGAIIQPKATGGTAPYEVFVWEPGYRRDYTEKRRLPPPRSSRGAAAHA